MPGLQRLHLPLQISTCRSSPLGGRADLRFAAAQATRQVDGFGGAPCKRPRSASTEASRHALQLIAAEQLPLSDQESSEEQIQQVAHTISLSAVVPEHSSGDGQSADRKITRIVDALCQLLPSQFPSATSAKKGVRRGIVLLNGKRTRVDMCALPDSPPPSAHNAGSKLYADDGTGE